MIIPMKLQKHGLIHLASRTTNEQAMAFVRTNSLPRTLLQLVRSVSVLAIPVCLLQTLFFQSLFAQQKSSAAAPASTGTPAAVSIAATTQSVTLNTSTGTLYGTLELPPSSGQVPLVIFMAGGMPIDRNGNSHLFADSTNTIKMLADGLLKFGVASLRYDKRGVAQSNKACRGEEELRVETYSHDAAAWGKKMQEDKRFSSVIVVGYSESVLPAIIAARVMSADGLVTVASSGRPMQEVYLDKASRFPSDLQQETRELVASLERGKRVDSVKIPLLYVQFRPSLQPYLISTFRYNPAKELGKVAAPCLVISGGKDYDVAVQETKMLAAGNPNAKLSIIESMTHSLREMQTPDQMGGTKTRSAAMASPLAPKLISDIADFVRTTTIRKKIRAESKAQTQQ